MTGAALKKKKKLKVPDRPDRKEERSLYSAGYRRIAGVDEAGRGALAGPVVAAAVILPEGSRYKWLGLVKDSKLLTEELREALLKKMRKSGVEIGIGIIEHTVIDDINILNATKKAMKMAIEQLSEPPDFVLTDHVPLPRFRIPQKNIVKGDRTCLLISCASIVAKVTRDHIMLELHARYPQYGFANHKGYGTSEHLEGLQNNGASEVHRLTFGPVKELKRLL
jgi:ribonuclease HII